MSRLTKSKCVLSIPFTAAVLVLSTTAMAWLDVGTVTAQEPELALWVYLPLILNDWPSLDYCEPNSMPSLACSIEPGVHRAHVSSPYDQDWYIFTLDREGDINIRLKVPGDDNYDLYLYGDPPGSPISYSVAPWNAEEVIEVTLPTGSYYILIFPMQQASESSYTLTLEVN